MLGSVSQLGTTVKEIAKRTQDIFKPSELSGNHRISLAIACPHRGTSTYIDIYENGTVFPPEDVMERSIERTKEGR